MKRPSPVLRFTHPLGVWTWLRPVTLPLRWPWPVFFAISFFFL
jgi:hypothetical protein